MSRRSIPAIVLVPLLVVALVVSSSACGTMANFKGGYPLIGITEKPRRPELYGGVRSDLELIPKKVCEDDHADLVIFLPWVIVDIAVSAVLDTLTAPLVAGMNIRYAMFRDKQVPPAARIVTPMDPSPEQREPPELPDFSKYPSIYPNR